MEWQQTLGNDSDDLIQKNLEKWHFFVRQILEAITPEHFPFLNPEVLKKFTETHGLNLTEGFQRLQKDLSGNGASFLNIPLTDTSAYSLGDTIACTPGNVIYQNDLIQLIHYKPVTEKIYQIPLLFIPPWINKYYILDLQPENSMVRWLIQQGISVYMISWINPDADLRHKTFSDYLTEGPLTAMEIIATIHGKKDINLAGYCIGGTLLACLLAILALEKKDSHIHSATFFTTLLNFEKAGDLGLFIDEPQLALLEQDMQTKGYMDGKILAAIFSLLRAGDLVWPAWVKHYLKNESPSASPFLYWNADSTNIPEKVHGFYLRNMYQNNSLMIPNQLKLADKPIDLSQITTPVCYVATERDHIAPWQACYRSAQLFSGPVQFVLAGAGHVAGIINPPERNRYAYRISGRKYRLPEIFAESTAVKKGSWWTQWAFWLKKHSGKKISAALCNTASIEPAPGSYVRKTITT